MRSYFSDLIYKSLCWHFLMIFSSTVQPSCSIWNMWNWLCKLCDPINCMQNAANVFLELHMLNTLDMLYLLVVLRLIHRRLKQCKSSQLFVPWNSYTYLGLYGYYRRFIRDYSLISKPLTNLLKKDSYHWSATTKDAFQHPKFAMVSAHVLALPDFS